MPQTILITGGAGFIGSHVNKLLNTQGYKTIVLDNLSRGSREAVVAGKFIEGDFGDRKLLTKIFNDHDIDGVIHFAAFTDVGESEEHPLRYIQNNLVKTITLLNTMIECDVKHIVFSSSAAVYGTPKTEAVTENTPTKPINYYGMTKLEVEKILEKYGQDYGLISCSLRYFNAAGGDPEGEIKNKKKQESNLIPVVLRSIIEKTTMTIFGTDYPTPDGTCIRDYVHVMDLAEAHILALKKLSGTSCYNLGNGSGFSVQEVIDTAETITGEKVDVLLGHRRPGDPAILIANSTKARKELGWTPKYPDLPSMIRDAWASYDP